MPHMPMSESEPSDKDEVKSGRVYIKSVIEGDTRTVTFMPDNSLEAKLKGEGTIFYINKLSNNGNYYSIQPNDSNSKYVSTANDGILMAVSPLIRDTEMFEIKKKGEEYTIKAKDNGKFVTDNIDKEGLLVAKAHKAKEWEKFEFVYLNP